MTADQIRQRIADRKPKIAPVPVEGEAFHVRELTSDDLAEWYQWQAMPSGNERQRAYVCLTLCDPDGKRVYQQAERDMLTGMPFSWVTTLSAAALTLNSGNALAQEALEKN